MADSGMEPAALEADIRLPLLRPLTEADVSAIGALAEAAGLFPAALAADLAAPALGGDDGERWLVAEDRTAFAYARAEEMTENTWNILAIAVAEESRGHGLGGALIGDMERATGARVMIIETTQRDEQAPARALYHKAGYRRAGHIPHFFAPDEDKIIFTKVLT